MARRIIAIGLVLFVVLLVVNAVVPSEVLEAQRRATATPLPTYYVVADANGRKCPELDCDVIEVFAAGEAVEITGTANGDTVRSSKSWYKVKMGRQTVYVHSSLLTDKKPAPRPTQRPGGVSASTPIPGSTSAPDAGPTSFVCPRNCASAVAMGLSAQQAATCPGLDRDKDGLACYGD